MVSKMRIRLTAKGFPFLLFLLTLSMSRFVVARTQDNLLINGDFEQAGNVFPSDWTMWGAQRYKQPEKYQVVTTQPHGGQRCLRILHSKYMAGHLISSPNSAIQAKPGTIYTVRFWARSERIGQARFLMTGYEKINPYKHSPLSKASVFDTSIIWQKYEYQFREGRDFDAKVSKLLMVGFFPYLKANDEDATLFIDDVSVIATPDPKPLPKINLDDLSIPALNHWLKPGKELEVTLDLDQMTSRTTQLASAISFQRVVGRTGQPYDATGAYTLDARLEAAIRELELPWTRFYAVADEPFSVEEAIDKIAELCRKLEIPLDRVVLELERQNAKAKLAPEVWARAAEYSQGRGYGIRYWEVSNEPWSSAGMGGAFASAEDYVEHVKQVASAIRKVQANARIGISVRGRGASWYNQVPEWHDFILAAAAGYYDFVASHYYICPKPIAKRPLEVVALSTNYRLISGILRDNAVIAELNNKKNVGQLDTEWGLHCFGSNGEKADLTEKNGNIWGTLHRAVRLVYYARAGLVEGASSWNMLGKVDAPGFEVLSQQVPGKRFLLYWLYREFNHHLGEIIVAMSGTAPWYTPTTGDDDYADDGDFSGPLTPVLATTDKTRENLFLVIPNASSHRAVPLTAHLIGFHAAVADGRLLQRALDAPALIEREADALSDLPLMLKDDMLKTTLPPHSVAFIKLESTIPLGADAAREHASKQ